MNEKRKHAETERRREHVKNIEKKQECEEKSRTAEKKQDERSVVSSLCRSIRKDGVVPEGKCRESTTNCNVIGAYPCALLLFLHYFLCNWKMFDLLGHFRSYSPNTMYFR